MIPAVTAIERLQQTGIRRLGTPKSGFRYVTASGKPVRGPLAQRLQELKIPPAWQDVAIDPSPGRKLQAIGRDKAGRWQYRYSDGQVVEREHKKYERLIAFGRAMPRARSAIVKGLRMKGLPRDRVMAAILRILSTCFMRPGSEVYAKENGSYGIATLKARHVRVEKDVVRFDFMGKSGQRQVRELRDARVARVVRELLKLPGPQLFKYVDEEGNVVPVTRQTLNTYIKEVMGERFSAKDFRTWSGTIICASVLARKAEEMVEGVTDRRKVISAAVKETAEHLGNTPAVCKSSYIWPSILSSFYKGRTLQPYQSLDELMACESPRPSPAEKAMLELLAVGRNATPIVIAKKLDRRRKRARGAETKMSRRMRGSGKMRRLAKAFTVH